MQRLSVTPLQHLPGGLDPADGADVEDAPGTGQAEQDPPLDGAGVADGGGDVEGLPVPEIVHGGAAGTLVHVAWGGRPHQSERVRECEPPQSTGAQPRAVLRDSDRGTTYTHICAHKHACARPHTCTQTRPHTCTFAQTRAHSCRHDSRHECVHTHTPTHLCTRGLRCLPSPSCPCYRHIRDPQAELGVGPRPGALPRTGHRSLRFPG